MTRTLRYDYLKYQDPDSDEILAVVRCPAGSDFAYEKWDGKHWNYLSDSFDNIAERPNWFPTSKQEALAQLPQLTERYARLEREKQRQKDLEEKQKIRNQRLDFTLRGMGGGWTDVERAANALHTMYTALFNAGFTDEQALKMCSELLAQPKRDALPPLLPVQQSFN